MWRSDAASVSTHGRVPPGVYPFLKMLGSQQGCPRQAASMGWALPFALPCRQWPTSSLASPAVRECYYRNDAIAALHSLFTLTASTAEGP